MTTPLLRTKLHIPRVRPELVPRPRLIELLNAGIHRKLTLVSAPAGFGKTTLLSEWVAECGCPVAWLSLDEGDNDPARFLAYLVATLQTAHSDLGEAALATLQSPQPPPMEVVLSALINDIAAVPGSGDPPGRPTVLILDDYHLISARAIHDSVAFLLDHLPLNLHLVVATRADPPLSLGRLRAGRQVTEIRANDLRFTEEEATIFLTGKMGLNLSAEDVAALEARTEGWIAGLQLAALSMRGEPPERTPGFVRAFTGSHRYVVDYLVEEVLKRRPPGTRDFLLQTSILNRLTGPLCDAVRFDSARPPGSFEGLTTRPSTAASPSEQGNGSTELTASGQAMLERLEEANLFLLPLDQERRWYRYHQLFADLLRNQLEASQPDLVPTLHQRASAWYEREGLVPEAVNHALAAEDYERAARLIEESASQLLERSELAQLIRLVNSLPDKHVRARPWLCVFHAWALRLTGAGLQAVESRLRDAERALEEHRAPRQADDVEAPSPPDEEATSILGHIAALRAYQALYSEEIPRAIELAHQALECRPEGSFVRGSIALARGWAHRFSGDLVAASRALDEARMIGQTSGNLYLAVAAACRAAHGLVLRGELRQAAEAYEEALQMATLQGGGRLPVAGYALVYLGGVHREWNDLDSAAEHLTAGIDLCGQVGYLMDQVVGHVGLARVKQAQRDHDGARDALMEAERLSRRMKSYLYVRRWVEDGQVHLWLAQGDRDAAVRWAEQSGLRADEEVSFLRELERIILARVLVARGRDQPEERHLSDALDLLSRLLEAAEAAGWMGKAIEILALQALAFQGQSDIDRALVALERALKLAKPQGYVRTFVDEGRPMAALLREAVARGMAQGYADRLLDAFGDGESESSARSPADSQAFILVDPLTDRELEVLRLLPTSLSGPEMAAELVVSINTLKTHTKRIYSKLNVHSRYEAIDRARELGLL